MYIKCSAEYQTKKIGVQQMIDHYLWPYVDAKKVSIIYFVSYIPAESVVGSTDIGMWRNDY